MGVFTYETEATSVIPPVRLFKAFALDDDNLIPKVAPQTITNIEIVEGNGGPGTVKKITFREGSQVKSVKEKVDAIDHANFTYGYTIIEADAFSDTLEKISYEIKMVASSDGGSILKSISHFHTKGDAEINEERVEADKEMASGFFKAVEAYLVAHPDEYK